MINKIIFFVITILVLILFFYHDKEIDTCKIPILKKCLVINTTIIVLLVKNI